MLSCFSLILSRYNRYRMGSRSNWGIVARSEAEFNEIVDNLNEQEVRLIVCDLSSGTFGDCILEYEHQNHF